MFAHAASTTRKPELCLGGKAFSSFEIFIQGTKKQRAGQYPPEGIYIKDTCKPGDVYPFNYVVQRKAAMNYS